MGIKSLCKFFPFMAGKRSKKLLVEMDGESFRHVLYELHR